MKMSASIISSILIFYGILIIVNIPATFIGLEFDQEESPVLWYAPPGFVIPMVWFILFTLLGISRYILLAIGAKKFQVGLFALAILCATYAYYTIGLAQLTKVSALWFGLIGNILVIIVAGWNVYKIFPFHKTASYLIIPVIVWTFYATLIVLGEMKLNGIF